METQEFILTPDFLYCRGLEQDGLNYLSFNVFYKVISIEMHNIINAAQAALPTLNFTPCRN